MRSALVFAVLAWSAVALAQVTGRETVTSQNAVSLGFSFELDDVYAGSRIRISVPDTISNGFYYAYTGVQLNDRDGNLILTYRPDTNPDVSSKSKYFYLVARPEALRCYEVTVTYLNPERPMHSDYLMEVELASFLDASTPECSLTNADEGNG